VKTGGDVQQCLPNEVLQLNGGAHKTSALRTSGLRAAALIDPET
jgi:hypothetical protein